MHLELFRVNGHIGTYLSSAVLATSSSTKSASTGSPAFLYILIGIGILAYIFYLRPQRKKMQAQRTAMSSIEVGDDVLTVGGVVGKVLEISGDRYTLLTGLTDDLGELSGAQPTRIVFVRQAISRKIDAGSALGGATGRVAGQGESNFDDDDDDVDPLDDDVDDNAFDQDDTVDGVDSKGEED